MSSARSVGALTATFDAATLSTLEAVFDTLIPATTEGAHLSPGGWLGGVQQLLAEHIPGFMDWAIEPLKAAAAALLSQDPAFATLPANERSAVVTAVEATAQGQPLVEHLVTIAYQGYYGGTREVAGWGVVGFTDVPPAATALDEDPLTGIPASALREHYDVVVIGGGAGGGVAANELAQAGYSVLIVERARPFRDRDLRGNHLQGKRADLYSSVVGPGPGHPRVLENADGSTEFLPGEGTGNNYGLVAMALGGGTRVWQGMAWRFYDEDFAMASIYGVPPGSTLADWPFGYDELEPYYSRVEWELGVCGDATSAMSRRTRRSRDYPMPALPDDDARRAYSHAATALGWEASPIPFSINSVARDGRAACVRCAQCIGHACPVNAKNGTHNTFIPRALATGRCDLLMSAQATFIEHDGRGTATAVRVVVETVDGPVERTIRADRVVVSAGAIETPRLLLVSGLGNDWVGRNHQSHGFAVAHALAGTSPKELIGPGHSVASVDWVHRDRLAWGGGVLFDRISATSGALALVLLSACTSSTSPEPETPSSEPTMQLHGSFLINQDFADPDVIEVDGSYVAFATESNRRNLQVATSPDLETWTVLEKDGLPTLPLWASAGKTWAPAVSQGADGRWVLYFTAASHQDHVQCIGVATADDPAGPYLPASDSPLICDEELGGAIDAAPFIDSDGTRYLLWKNDGNSRGLDTWIFIAPTSPDGLTLAGEPVPLIKQTESWEGDLVEAPTLIQREGKYWLLYSANFYGSPEYTTGAAWSDSLLGPYTKMAEPLLTSDATQTRGPGGQAVVATPDGDVILFHSWDELDLYRGMLKLPLNWVDGQPVADASGRQVPMS